MKKHLTKTVSLLVSTIVLAGCSNFPKAFDHGGNPITQPFNYEKAQALKAEGHNFKDALVKEYQALSTKEGQVWADWFDSDFFARKALKVAQSENGLPPEDPAMWRFSTEELTQFADGYSALNAALDKSRTTLPVLSAKAQASFDCWVEEEEEGWQNDEIAKCKDQFAEALKRLTGAQEKLVEKTTPQPALDMAKLYTVFFDFDSATVTPIGRQVLQALVEDWGAQTVNYALIGHTDRSGSQAYNRTLSERRALSVKKLIAEFGLPSDRITTTAMGESAPAVATQDGVREAKNRRVVIEVKQ
jgi:OOP family OmpA-OmpF porin